MIRNTAPTDPTACTTTQGSACGIGQTQPRCRNPSAPGAASTGNSASQTSPPAPSSISASIAPPSSTTVLSPAQRLRVAMALSA